MDFSTVTANMVTIIVAVFASSGFWALLAKRFDKKTAIEELLLGLAHDRITFLASKYIARGYITTDEYENLHAFLYQPYLAVGGNGTAKRVMEEVNRLPISTTSKKPSEGD